MHLSVSEFKYLNIQTLCKMELTLFTIKLTRSLCVCVLFISATAVEYKVWANNTQITRNKVWKILSVFDLQEQTQIVRIIQCNSEIDTLESTFKI